MVSQKGTARHIAAKKYSFTEQQQDYIFSIVKNRDRDIVIVNTVIMINKMVYDLLCLTVLTN